jgi:conjugal transfer pilus assembly protein TraF
LRRLFILIFATFLSAASICAAEDTYYQKNTEGWFFYKDPLAKPSAPKEEPLPAPAKTEAPAPTVKKPEPFSVEWMKQKVEILRNNAIANPTEENTRAYMYAQRLVLDMSQNFAEAGSKVVENDPYLNENFRSPTASALRRGALWQVAKAREAIARDVAGKAGLWFFFESSCAFCNMQFPIVKDFAKEYGYHVKFISLDGKALPGMSKAEFVTDYGKKTFQALGLKLTPAVVLAVPPDKMLVVAHGAMPQDELEKKIVQAAIDKEIADKSLSDLAQLEKRGLITATDIADLKKTMGDTDDPQELVRMMQIAIGKRM